MNTISHINRNTKKQRKQRKPGIGMSKENLLLIKETLEASNLDVEIVVSEDFEAGDKTVEEALKEEENKL